MPVDLVADVCSMRLLLDARLDILLGIADFGPAVVSFDFGGCVGIDLREGRMGGFNLARDIGEGHG